MVEKSPSRWGEKINARSVAWAAALALAAGVGISEVKDRLDPPSRFEKLAAKFQMNSYKPEDVSSFSVLAYLDADLVKGLDVSQRQVLGREIQQDAAYVFLAALEQGVDNKGVKIDMYNVVNQLIPQDTQKALEEEGFVFIPKSPVTCDAPAANYGDHGYDPLDYSNNSNQDFAVTTTKINGRDVTYIPLGAEQTPALADPFYRAHNIDRVLYEDYLSIKTLPCVDQYPHEVYPPNNSTYPHDTKLQIHMW